jgi:hypothetical protein
LMAMCWMMTSLLAYSDGNCDEFTQARDVMSRQSSIRFWRPPWESTVIFPLVLQGVSFQHWLFTCSSWRQDNAIKLLLYAYRLWASLSSPSLALSYTYHLTPSGMHSSSERAARECGC